MKIINNQLYLRINELIDCGIPKMTIYDNIKADWIDIIEDDEQGKLLPYKQLKKAWLNGVETPLIEFGERNTFLSLSPKKPTGKNPCIQIKKPAIRNRS